MPLSDVLLQMETCYATKVLNKMTMLCFRIDGFFKWNILCHRWLLLHNGTCYATELLVGYKVEHVMPQSDSCYRNEQVMPQSDYFTTEMTMLCHRVTFFTEWNMLCLRMTVLLQNGTCYTTK